MPTAGPHSAAHEHCESLYRLRCGSGCLRKPSIDAARVRHLRDEKKLGPAVPGRRRLCYRHPMIAGKHADRPNAKPRDGKPRTGRVVPFDGADPPQPLIGMRVRALRRQQRRRLKEVADEVGCSESLLSRVENGLVVPSLTTLHRLARALRVAVSLLVQAGGEATCTIYAPSERPSTAHAGKVEGDGSTAESLVPYAENRRLDAMVVSLPSGGSLCGPFTHEGEEVGLVLEGTLELHVDGTVYTVPTQSSFFLSSTRPHSYRASGAGTCRVVWMNTPPTF